MVKFKVNTSCISSQSKIMTTLAREVCQCTNQINRITNNLKSSNSSKSMVSIQSTLSTQSQRLISLEQSMQEMSTILKQISDIYTKTEQDISDIARTDLRKELGKFFQATDFGSDEILNPSNSPSKSEFIRNYETQYPDIASRVDKYLGQMSNFLIEDDIENIKYLIYSAEEPYRTIFLNNLKKYKVTDLNQPSGNAYYQPWYLFTKDGHTLHYSYPECFGNDPRGPYTTLFHESGHAIDDLANKSKWMGSDTENYKAYSKGLGQNVTIRQAILYDVYDNPSNPHSMTSIANNLVASGNVDPIANTSNVINAIRNGTNLSNLSAADRELYNAVINEHQNRLRNSGTSGAHYESVSDVYGGVSGNVLRNGYGHDSGYWKDDTKAAKELWAEYFSYNMAQDTDNLNYLREYFPEASQILESYANDLVN